MLPLSITLALAMFAAWHFGWHAKAVTAGVLLLAGLSHVFAWILGVIALVPIIGPVLVKVLSLSIIWLLNAIGYLVSFVAIKRGYSKDVLTYRAVTIALMTGIVIGYVIGSLVYVAMPELPRGPLACQCRQSQSQKTQMSYG